MEEQPAPLVSVVIPNWNGLVHLPECIEALRCQTYPAFEVSVVDNDSTDGSVDWLQKHAPEVAIIRRPHNDGFAAAANAGIRSAAGEFIYLLNNDTRADPRCIEELVLALQRSRFDFAASLLVFYDDPSLVNTAGEIYAFSEFSGVQRGTCEPVDQYLQPMRILGACGGAAMYRRTFFDAVGLYDEDFFLFHEDVDINLRAMIAGQRCMYVPTSIVLHKVGGTVGRTLSPEIQREWRRNARIVMGKDLPDILLPYIVGRWAWHNFREYLPLRPSKWHRIPAKYREFRELFAVEWEGYSLGRSKRGDVWKRRQVSTREILRWLRKGAEPL